MCIVRENIIINTRGSGVHTYIYTYIHISKILFWGCVMVERLAYLLTEKTSDEGSLPHVAKRGNFNDVP